MLHATPELSPALRQLLGELVELRGALHDHRPPQRWEARLRRMTRGSVASSSVGIEGFRVDIEAASALLAGERRPDGLDDEVVAAYGRAMDHVVALADDPHFKWNLRVLLDLHFDVAWPHPAARAGRLRTGPVYVTGGDGGVIYTAPEAEALPELMRELVRFLRADRGDTPPIVVAAMAHLHLVSIHPFKDGNGRTSRVLQSLVLGLGGSLAPELASIEEFLAGHTDAYYDQLHQAQGAVYDPSRSAAAWVEFCVQAHVVSARGRIAQLEQATRRWRALEDLAQARGWPDRFVIALEQASTAQLDRASYVAESGVSEATASTDLRRLVDAGYLVSEGGGRSTRYGPSDALRELLVR